MLINCGLYLYKAQLHLNIWFFFHYVNHIIKMKPNNLAFKMLLHATSLCLSITQVTYMVSIKHCSLVEYLNVCTYLKSSHMFSAVVRRYDVIFHFLYGTDHMLSPFTVNTDSVQNRLSFRLWTLMVNESVGGERSKFRTDYKNILRLTWVAFPENEMGKDLRYEWHRVDRN